MRYLRAAGAACLAVVAMLAVAGGAWASVLTSPAGTNIEAGTTIKAESSNISLDGTIDINCSSSLEAEAGNSGTTVNAPVKSLAFTGCGADTVSVLKGGSLELHATGGGNGTTTWSGAEITVQLHRSVFGFPVTTHCIYAPANTDLGTFTGSATTKATATLDLAGPNLPQKATDSGCGSNAQFTGSYTFTSPDYLDVDVESTALTSPAGTNVLAGTAINAEGTFELDGSVDLKCTSSTLEAEAGNSGTTVNAPVKSLSLTGCGPDTASVLKGGSLELHATGSGNGTTTWSGAEITVQLHRTIFGFAITTHCIYTPDNTDLGTFTGSATTKATAILHLSGPDLPRQATDSGCGENSQLTGSYTFTSPDYLDVDVESTPLTSPAGTNIEAGTTIKAESSNVELDGSVDLKCTSSTLEAEAGNSGTTVNAPVKSLSLTGCGPDTASVLKGGSLELHATGSGDGTATWSGAEITVQLHRSVFGFAVTTHCIYTPDNTDLGTFTGSATTKATAKLDLIGPNLPQKTTDSACGSSAQLTGSYTFTSPDYLDMD